MARVYVSIGSNVDRERTVLSCLRILNDVFGPLSMSNVYETPAVGFEGDDFYNLVVGFETDEDVHTLSARLRAIEAAHGRRRTGARFSARTLDLDVLTYDDLVLQDDGLEIPRGEITRYAFVLGPLAEVAGMRRHPVLGLTFGELWENFDKTAEPELRPVELSVPV
jgi:2-amino-4-hydroxy-6-hydroxymethyldihydropteridine diphosphokinase